MSLGLSEMPSGSLVAELAGVEPVVVPSGVSSSVSLLSVPSDS